MIYVCLGKEFHESVGFISIIHLNNFILFA